MIHIPPSVAERAHDVADLTAGEVVSLVVESAATAVIGIFPTGYPEEPWRSHCLSGALGDDLSDATILRFPTSMASFHAKQACRAAIASKNRPVRRTSPETYNDRSAPAMTCGGGQDERDRRDRPAQ
jgi:hypothetical protein